MSSVKISLYTFHITL
jgi:hypothetical protein